MSEEDKKYSVFNSNIVIGLGIILFGVLLLLNSLDAIPDISFTDYWPCLIIFVGLSKLFKRPLDMMHIFWALFFVVIGTLFQLSNLEYINFWFDDLWPILIIVAGLSVIRSGIFGSGGGKHTCGVIIDGSGDNEKFNRFSRFHGSKSSAKNGAINGDQVNLEVVLGSSDSRVTTRQFKGGKLSAVLGSIELDFTSADMEGDSVELFAECVMASIELRVPYEWEVIMEGSPFLGAFDNKTAPPREQGKRLIIKGSAVMGAIEVKN